MNKVLSILLIEDDPNACEDIQNCIEQVSDIVLVGTTNNSNEALEMVQATFPDVILLDLELHQGGGNGLLFLQKLNQIQLPNRPYILITTNNASEITFKAARQFGADFILTKYEANYSAQYVVDFVYSIKDAIKARIGTCPNEKQPLTPKQREQRLIQRIQHELNLIGVSPKAVGFKYLTDAILLTIQESQQKISCALAQKYGKNDASVERAMQNAINNAWRSNDPEDLLKYYTARIRSDRGVPTMMEFIYYYATKIKNEIE